MKKLLFLFISLIFCLGCKKEKANNINSIYNGNWNFKGNGISYSGYYVYDSLLNSEWITNVTYTTDYNDSSGSIQSGENIDADNIKIYIGDELVTFKGMIYKNYSEDRATKHLKQSEVDLSIDVGVGKSHAKVYTCDLTHKYIEINADYRS